MAITKEVKVIISAVDQYSSGFLNFNKGALGVLMTLEKVAMAMVVLSTAAAAVATKLGTEVWQSASDFHDAMYNVEAVAQSFGTTGGQISDILDDLTQKFPITGQQAGAALQLIAQLGYGTEVKLRDMADAANTLQIATGADLQTGIMGTLAILNPFNLESGEASRVINLLASASFTSAANVEDLGISLRYAAPIASLMGVSVEETVAAIAKLRDRGLEASQTGTTLRMALIQLGKETEKKTEVLKKYGLTMADVNPEVVGLTGVIEAFKDQTISGSDAAVLFGTRSVAFANIVNMGADAFRSYTASISDTSAAYDAMEKKLVTWDVVQRQITGNIDLFKKSIAGGLVPEILHLIGTTETEGFRGVINYMTELENEIGNLNESFSIGLEGFASAIETIFQDAFGGKLENVYEYISLIALGLAENLRIVLDWGAALGTVLIKSTNDFDGLKMVLTVINATFAALAVPIALIHDVISNMFAAWRLGVDFLMWSLDNAHLRMHEVAESLLEVINRLSFGSWDKELIELRGHMAEIKNDMKAPWDGEYFNMWTDDAAQAFLKVQQGIIDLQAPADVTREKIQKIAEAMDKDSDDHTMIARFNMMEERWSDVEVGVRDYVAALKVAEEPLNKNAEAAAKLSERWVQLKNFAQAGGVKLFDYDDIEVTEMAVHGLEAYQKRVDSSGQSMRQSLDALDAYEKGLSNIAKVAKDEEVITNMVQVNGKWIEMTSVVKKATEETYNLNQAIDDMSDREFTLFTEKFRADLDLAKQKVEETHETIREKIEWQAKLDIEEAKASAEILKAAFAATGESVTATADATASMVSSFTELATSAEHIAASDKWFIEKQINAQMELQKAALENQKMLTEAEVRNMDARTDRIKNLSNEALITVNGDGLKPHLEMIMWEIFEAIQIRATEEGLGKLLLGGAT